MGRKTWDSLPATYRPLPQRENIVLSTQSGYTLPSATVYHDFEHAISDLKNKQSDQLIDRVFLIGGMQLYQLGVVHPLCKRVYITHVQGNFDCDCFFPELNESFKNVHHSAVYTENKDSVPFLSKLPVISPFFNNKAQVQQESEIMIAITPKIINGNETP